jgi:myo-inositol-1(or 4)-monophosphatase
MNKPKQILQTLFPFLKTAALYSRNIQASIETLPDKEEANFFAQALTAADLSIQSLVEVVLLAHFPEIRFFGEEYEKSYNTPYLKGTTWGAPEELLITLDPIDGTRYFADRHDNYQIILSILTSDSFRASLLISPRRDRFLYALKDEGMFVGDLSASAMDEAIRLKIDDNSSSTILVSSKAKLENPKALEGYTVLNTEEQYSKTESCLMGNDMFFGKLAGVVYGKASLIDAGALIFSAEEAGFSVQTYDGQPIPPPGSDSDLMASPAIIGRTPEIASKLLESKPTIARGHRASRATS